jgi:phage terminase small subunit
MPRKGAAKRAALNPLEARFVAEYLKDKNGHRAAIAAGYKDGPGIDVTACRLLRRPKIAAAVAKAGQKAIDQAAVTAGAVLEELGRLALGDRTALMGAKTVAELQALPVALRSLVSDFEIFDANVAGVRDGKTDRVRRVRTYPKGQALELLAKHFKLLVEVHEHTLTDELLARLDRGRARNAERNG